MGVAVGGRGLGVCVGMTGGVGSGGGGAARDVGVLEAGASDAGGVQHAAVSTPASTQVQSAVSRSLATLNPLSLRWKRVHFRGMFPYPGAVARSERAAWQR